MDRVMLGLGTVYLDLPGIGLSVVDRFGVSDVVLSNRLPEMNGNIQPPL